ncbi:sulfite reductase subunit alpha [Comamonas testosteroni]|uniref:sulfite reductase subunit alpha n=1 Tax=Comamonas testosteroni TaxID=285 RepID=UPI00037F6DDF|nr:sulfite reductase subunit alpha [Comamonas testosteroni]
MTVEWILTPERIYGAMGLVAAYAGMCWGIGSRVRRQRLIDEAQSQLSQGDAQAPAVLVAYASQTGQAEALARATAKMLVEGGLQVRLLPVEKLTTELLQEYAHSLWMLSTTGEGDAPDHALGFVQQLMAAQPVLTRHQSLVLALGDREYQEFCAFGVQVHEWLQTSGARSDLVCVDNMDGPSLQSWQAQVGQIRQSLLGESASAQELDADWLQAPASVAFVLSRRRLLNPGSQGGALYQLEWTPQSGELPPWESGDLVSLCVPADPERARDYSIASITADGSLQLLVRESTRADGSPGLASHWLCCGMAEGDVLSLTLREHRGFRLGDNAGRSLILIGNGSGLAGLLSHIKARVQQDRNDQWLLFGERSPQHDAFCAEQLAAWVEQGRLARLDQAWSRNGKDSRYVQDLLRSHAEEVRQWVERGAAIYVCGSLNGMGQGVHLTLQAILGEAKVAELQGSGRYRRDVY